MTFKKAYLSLKVKKSIGCDLADVILLLFIVILKELTAEVEAFVWANSPVTRMEGLDESNSLTYCASSL